MARFIDADRALEIVYKRGIAHPNAYYLTNYARSANSGCCASCTLPGLH